MPTLRFADKSALARWERHRALACACLVGPAGHPSDTLDSLLAQYRSNCFDTPHRKDLSGRELHAKCFLYGYHELHPCETIPFPNSIWRR